MKLTANAPVTTKYGTVHDKSRSSAEVTLEALDLLGDVDEANLDGRAVGDPHPADVQRAVAMGDVQDVGHAEYQGEAEGHQGINAAQQQAA